MKDLYSVIYKAGIVPILLPEENCMEKVIPAIEGTSIPVVEILQRGAQAEAALREAVKIKKNAFVGAGTIYTLEQCKRMVDLGADFIVSPGFDAPMVDWCIKRGVPVIPGVSGPTEIMQAANLGVKMVKFFPFLELGGEEYLNGCAGPFADLNFVVTGCLDDRHLPLLSNKRIAAVGGVWMFQSETVHTVVPTKEITSRLKLSLQIARHYRNGW